MRGCNIIRAFPTFIVVLIVDIRMSTKRSTHRGHYSNQWLILFKVVFNILLICFAIEIKSANNVKVFAYLKMSSYCYV